MHFEAVKKAGWLQDCSYRWEREQDGTIAVAVSLCFDAYKHAIQRGVGRR